MGWVSDFFTSSLGRKLVMSLTGLFLILFLVIHLVGNLQLLKTDGGEAFNIYTAFMSKNPLIQLVSKGLYLFILIHTFLGINLWWKNRKAKGRRYLVRTSANASFASKNMALLGILIFAFILIHMGDFWFKIKFTPDIFAMMEYEGMDYAVKNAYQQVVITFEKPIFVITYVIGMIVLAFHLWHGFQSAFQTLGLNHSKYTPAIEWIGKAFSILVPALFALIPIYMYLA